MTAAVKAIIRLCIVLALLWAVFMVGREVEKEAHRSLFRELVFGSTREQVMALQMRVGCDLIDGKNGPETVRKTKAAVIAEDLAYANESAKRFMTETGGPK